MSAVLDVRREREISVSTAEPAEEALRWALLSRFYLVHSSEQGPRGLELAALLAESTAAAPTEEVLRVLEGLVAEGRLEEVPARLEWRRRRGGNSRRLRLSARGTDEVSRRRMAGEMPVRLERYAPYPPLAFSEELVLGAGYTSHGHQPGEFRPREAAEAERPVLSLSRAELSGGIALLGARRAGGECFLRCLVEQWLRGGAERSVVFLPTPGREGVAGVEELARQLERPLRRMEGGRLPFPGPGGVVEAVERLAEVALRSAVFADEGLRLRTRAALLEAVERLEAEGREVSGEALRQEVARLEPPIEEEQADPEEVAAELAALKEQAESWLQAFSPEAAEPLELAPGSVTILESGDGRSFFSHVLGTLLRLDELAEREDPNLLVLVRGAGRTVHRGALARSERRDLSSPVWVWEEQGVEGVLEALWKPFARSVRTHLLVHPRPQDPRVMRWLTPWGMGLGRAKVLLNAGQEERPGMALWMDRELTYLSRWIQLAGAPRNAHSLPLIWIR